MALIGKTISEFDFSPDSPPAIIGELVSGQVVNIELWEDGKVVSVSSGLCAEIGNTGRYSWSTDNIPVLISSRRQFHWRMSDGTHTYDGDFVLVYYENRDEGMPSVNSPSSYIVQN